MNAARTDMFSAAHLPLLADDAQCLAEANRDEDWEEFLSLGLVGDPALLGQGAGWQRAPVLLSY